MVPFKVVTVEFPNDIGGKHYAFRTDIEDLKHGDFVAVDTQVGLGVAMVVKARGLTAPEAHKATRWIVQKLDMKAHVERLKREEVAQEIRNKLRERKEQMEEILIYERLAKDDPGIQKLLDELKTIEGGGDLTKLLT